MTGTNDLSVKKIVSDAKGSCSGLEKFGGRIERDSAGWGVLDLHLCLL